MKKQLFILSVLFVCILSMACFADNYVIINQVMYDTPLNEQTNISPCSNGEYIELYNAGTSTVYLQGWRLTGGSASEIWTFGNSDSITVGGYLILACRRGSTNTFVLSNLYNQLANTNYSIVYQNKIILTNTGETITLYNAQNDTVDQMQYGNFNQLYATNVTDCVGDSCVSLHRAWVEFDDAGKVIQGTNLWRTEFVSFNRNMLPYDSYYENFITGEQALPLGENYVLRITPLDPTTRIDITDGRPSVSSGVRFHANLRYLDGLGRQEESIALGLSPDNNDLVSILEYNGTHKIARQWLPVVMGTEGQHIRIAEVESKARTDFDDNQPFSETQYENSARLRPITQKKAGRTFSNNPATCAYGLNRESDQVRIYTVNSDSSLHTDGTYYNTASLYKCSYTDEDGKTIIIYTDKQGHEIMEDRDGSRTYYVYDNLERLRFILPNLPSTKLNNGNYPLSNNILKTTAYCYNYDSIGNIVYKRLPGCEPQFMVYDQLRQLVLKQDGNQRKKNKWTMCAYDTIGRFIYIAEIKLTDNHKHYVDFFADKWQVEHYGTNQANAISNTGYASTLLGNNNLRPLIVNYFDNHEYLSSLATTEKKGLLFAQETGYGTQYDNAKGLLTGTRVYNLSEDGCYTTASYYYDTQGRVVQQRSIRSNDGYKTATSTEYLFDGSIAQQLTVQGPDSNLVQEHYRYTYDHAGRLLNTYYQHNNDAEITLSAFSYDSIGHLAQNLLHNERDTILYSYDMRDMLTKISNKHFSERLFFADSLPSSVNACHNGNIAATRISYKDSIYTFAYAYDLQNRLISSSRLTEFGTSYSEQFQYDSAGNILSLKRFNNNRLIDSLSYSYGNDGHQLLAITDNGQDADLYDMIEYHNGEMQTDTTMCYDANGNLIYDADRGISVIRYNMLNLPDTIQFVNGNQIVNLYDATGRKYKSIVYTVPVTAVTPRYEIMHYTLETDTVEYLVTEYTGNIENIYSRIDTTQRIFNSTGYYTDSTFYHYIKDHLGNICAVVNSVADTLMQKTAYFASGVPSSTNLDEQPYFYNGKEFISAHGLNTFDYGFRGYYATIGRFSTIDPLAEQTPWQSPYAYAGNRFVNAIDWMGLGELDNFSHSGSICQYIVYDGYTGIVLDYDLDDDDRGVYVYYGDDWEIGGDRTGLQVIGTHKRGLSFSDIIGSGGVLNFNMAMESFTCLPKDVPCLGQLPGTFQKGVDVAQNILNSSSNTLDIGTTVMCNDFWWIGKNGNTYFKYQRLGPQQYVYNRSYEIAKQTIKPIRQLAKGLSGASIIFDALEIVIDEEVKPSNIINTTIAAFAFVPGGEWIPIVYGLVDITTIALTGESLGNRADNYWGTIKY